MHICNAVKALSNNNQWSYSSPIQTLTVGPGIAPGQSEDE